MWWMLKSSMREKMIKCIQRKVEPQTEGMHSVGLTFYKKKERKATKQKTQSWSWQLFPQRWIFSKLFFSLRKLNCCYSWITMNLIDVSRVTPPTLCPKTAGIGFSKPPWPWLQGKASIEVEWILHRFHYLFNTRHSNVTIEFLFVLQRWQMYRQQNKTCFVPMPVKLFSIPSRCCIRSLLIGR